MRHRNKTNSLSRTASHRRAMFANMASSLIQEKQIVTTLPKAKALRRYVEPLITKSKTDTVHSRRSVFASLQDKYAVQELFAEVSPRIMDRPGGYTRILKLGPRGGDAAEMALIELVDFNEFDYSQNKGDAATGKKKRRRRGKKSKGGGEQQQPTAVATDSSSSAEAAPEAPAAEEAAPEQSAAAESPKATAPSAAETATDSSSSAEAAQPEAPAAEEAAPARAETPAEEETPVAEAGQAPAEGEHTPAEEEAAENATGEEDKPADDNSKT